MQREIYWRQDYAVTVCVANRISGRQQKPVALREQSHPTIYRRNPLPLGRGGCQKLQVTLMAIRKMSLRHSLRARASVQLSARRASCDTAFA